MLSGDILATVDTELAAPNTAHSTPNKENIGSGELSENEKTVAQKIGPAVKKLLIEKEIDPKLIQGSGKDGRITKEDVNLFLKNSVTSEKPSQTTGETSPKNREKSAVNAFEKTHCRKAFSRSGTKCLVNNV